MRPQPAPPASADVRRSPSFSLGTALLWLGHDCPGLCPPTAVDARAAVWFLHLPDRTVATWTKTLVDVDFQDTLWSDGERDELLSGINHCVRADKLRVRERTAAERATFFAALAARRGGIVRPQLVTATLPTNHPILSSADL